MKSKTFFCFCLILILLNSNIIYASDKSSEEPFFTLNLVTNPPKPFADYALMIAQYLADINIAVEIHSCTETFPIWCGYNWDLFLGEFSSEIQDIRTQFSEGGSRNIFGLNKEIPYCNRSEQLQNQALVLYDLDERYYIWNEWCWLLMDFILPFFPFFLPRSYQALWSNIKNYDIRWGLADSLPYMSYEGFHEGQNSIDELNVADSMWKNLNPILSQDKASDFLINLISEPLLAWSPDGAPLKTGIIDNWEQINDFHYKFYMRDNIFWNPSYDITLNHNDSIPLENTPLMSGLKGEFSNGTNQLLTAKDAVFTLLSLANNLTHIDSINYSWLSNTYVDDEDPFSFHIEIDGNPSTPEKEYYNEFFQALTVPILPEFFLNSTTNYISYTDGGTKCWGFFPGITETPEWEKYSITNFNCGKYLIYYSIENNVTVLQRNTNWFGIGTIDGSKDLQPFIERINIKCIPNSAEALREFKEGKLELLEVTELPLDRKEMQDDPKFEVQTEIKNQYSALAFNLKRPKIGGLENSIFLNESGKEEYTKAIAIRKAICHVIDREIINQVVHNGEYTLIHRPISLPNMFHYDDFIKYYRDLDAAWEWMEAAGYKRPDARQTFTLDAGSSISILLIFLATSSLILKLKRRRK